MALYPATERLLAQEPFFGSIETLAAQNSEKAKAEVGANDELTVVAAPIQ